jgi:hypothetical protein
VRIKLRYCLFFVLLLCGDSKISGGQKSETSPLELVTEYIRELAMIENIRESAAQELAKSSPADVQAISIHMSTLVQLELQTDIGRLSAMHLNLKTPFDSLLPDLIGFYKQKIMLHEMLMNINGKLLVPKPGVDYGELAATLPKIRAQLEYVDDGILRDVTPMMFFTLLDLKEESKNHVSHLIITKAERAKLIEDLDRRFGSKLDQKDQNFTVSSASALKGLILKWNKCSDDPWN